MNQHTPGPWFVIFGDNDEGDHVYGIEAKNGSDIVITDAGFYPPCGADAYLIAAAPDLLALAYQYLGDCESLGADCSDIRAVIAKATPPEGKSANISHSETQEEHE